MKNEASNNLSLKMYKKGSKWWKAIILTILSGLETPFNTGTYALFFWLMQEQRLEWLLPFVGIYVASYAILLWIGKQAIKATNNYKAQVITDIKMACVKNAIAEGIDSGTAISFIDNDLKLVMANYFDNIIKITKSSAVVVFTIILTFSSNWIFALIYLVIGLLPMGLGSILGRKTAEMTNQYTESISKTTVLIKDVIKNSGTIINYNRIADTIKKLFASISKSEKDFADRNNEMEFTGLYMNIVYIVVNIIPIAIGIYMGIKGYITIPAFIAVQYSSGWIVGSLGQIAGLMAVLKSTEPIRENIMKFSDIDEVNENEAEDVKKIEFKEVDFAYNEDKEILKKFSFKAENGSKILIQGESGSGKSTILKLISGELKPDSGKVLLNDKELKYRRLGFISQNPAVFNETLRYNITLGKDFTEEEINKAAEQAGLYEFVRENGLDYIIEDEGGNISGGQKQRIEIARALLYNCSVLLVDEGTSALDKNTADKIHETIMSLNKTVVEVAHHIPDEVRARFDTILELG